MAELKSLAHPEWPYAGTAHEWRGFVKANNEPIYIEEDGKNYYGNEAVLKAYREFKAVYQKQNFGPELK